MKAKPSPGGAKRKDAYHHGNLRQVLVDTAVKLIADNDVASLSLREVARAAGVTAAAPYHHFPDKRALLAAVAEEGYRALARELCKVVDRYADRPAEAFPKMLGAYVAFAGVNPSQYQVMLSPVLKDEEAFPQMHAAGAEALTQVKRCIRLARGARASEAEVERLALLAWAMAHGIASLWIEGPLQKKLVRIEPLLASAAHALTAAMLAGA